MSKDQEKPQEKLPPERIEVSLKLWEDMVRQVGEAQAYKESMKIIGQLVGKICYKNEGLSPYNQQALMAQMLGQKR